MKRTKHVFALLALSFLALNACGKNQNDEFTPKLDQQTACRLTVRGHYENFEALTAEFHNFSEYYPNVELNYEYDKDHKKNISLSLKGDTPPDIFFTYSTIDFSAIDEYTEDLSDKSLGFDLSCIRDDLLYRDSNNKVPYLPIYTTSYGMLINENLFKANNVKVPETYSELITACDSFKKASPKIYPMLGHESMVMYPLYFPHFCATLVNNKTAVDELNSLAPSAGEHMRASLEIAHDFMSKGFVDLEECTTSISDDYDKTIKRFYNGDVAMMLAKGGTVSGTEKRESQSEAFTNNPFKYSFHPVPSTDKGGYFYNTVDLCFSVNKKSQNLAMANEFMRFVISSSCLNRMAKAKRMITPCKDMTFDEVYSAFGKIEVSRIINPSHIGLLDAADKQVRKAGIAVCQKGMSVDEAVRTFGSFE